MTPREQKNTEKITVFFSPEHLDTLREEAKKKGTSMSGLVRMVVIEYLDKK